MLHAATAVGRRFIGLPFVLAIASCKEPAPAPDGVRLEESKTTRDGVEVALAFERAGSTIPPPKVEGDRIRVEVTDTDWGRAVPSVSGKKHAACESTAPLSSGVVDSKKKTVTLQVTMSCPRVRATVTREIDVTFLSASGVSRSAHGFLQSYDADSEKIIFSK